MALAACGSTGTTGQKGPTPIPAEIGILAGNTGQEVSFGRAPEGALAAVTRMTGRPPETVATGLSCPHGIVQSARYRDGLTLFFTREAFVGWHVDDGTGQSAGDTCI